MRPANIDTEPMRVTARWVTDAGSVRRDCWPIDEDADDDRAR